MSEAITWFFERERCGVVLEDDCVPAQDFLPFCSEPPQRYASAEPLFTRTVIVCSSAMHLPRAANRYRALGFQVIPLPCDFATRDAAEAWSWALLSPRGLGLAQIDSAFKEWMGGWRAKAIESQGSGGSALSNQLRQRGFDIGDKRNPQEIPSLVNTRT